MKFELVRPTMEMEEKYNDFVKDWDINEEPIVPYSARLLDMNYKTWLENTYLNESKETCSKNFVPAHTYFLIDEDKNILGAINIRHYLNEYLLNYGGHIGYGIRPSERKKGYASLQLAMALKKAREFGIDKALVTCDKDSVGSAKTIMKNGGVLENEVLEEDVLKQRYWIELKI